MHPINRLRKPLLSGRRAHEPAGAVLIAIIIAITLFAALGAAIYSISSSETYGSLASNLGMRSYYAAESGYRYAVNEYRADTSRIEALHNATRALPDGLGTFSISNHAFFFITTTDATTGDNYLYLKTPGEFPSGFTVPDDIRITIDGTIYNAELNFQTPPDSVSFEITGGLTEDVPAGAMVCLVADVSGSQTLAAGGPLTVSPNVGNLFPEQNGQIEVNDLIYSYKTCTPNGNESILAGIKGVDNAARAALPMALSGGSAIILRPLLDMTVTGRAADNLLGGSREISYLFPITDEILGNAS
jgi:hypothetical protein